MLEMFRKKWKLVLLVVAILVLAVGAPKIKSLSMNKFVRQLLWPLKKAGKDIAVTKKAPEFKAYTIRPEMYGLNPRVYVKLSHGFDLDKIKGYIEITPEISFYIEEGYSGIEIYADFKPGESYNVKLLKGMPSTWKDLKLKQTVSKTIVVPDYNPTFSFKSPGMIMSLKGNQTIAVEVINVDKLKVKVHKVYDNNVVYLLNNKTSYSFPSNLGVDTVEKEIDTGTERNEKKEVLLNLRDILAKDTHGLYYMKVSDPSGDYWSDDARKLILTTDLGMLSKKSDSSLFIWLNSLSTASAVSDAVIKVFTKTNQQILEGITDENGFAHFKDVDWSGDRKPFVVTASKDRDVSFIELEKCAISETDFDTSGRPYLSSDYEAFLYTDRGIYRPGETAHLRAILRGVGHETPESFPIIFDIKKPDTRQFKKLNAMLSGFGTVDIEVDIPDYALTGKYTAYLKLPGSTKVLGECKFNIEEFMPDRLKVEIDLPDKRFSAKEIIPISIKAEHFFGAAAPGREVEATCYLAAADFKSDKYKDYVFKDATRKFSKNTLPLGVKESDKKGEAGFDLAIPEGMLPPSALSASISATVKELGGRAVSSRITRYVDPYSYYIGIKEMGENRVDINTEADFDIVVRSPEDGDADINELDVSVSKVIWSSAIKKDEKGEYRYISESREEGIFETSVKIADGAGKFTYAPRSSGDYVLRIKGKDKNAHASSIKFDCWETGYMPWAMERPDRVELELDKKSYKPGDIARLLVKSPFKGKALVTISQDKILQTDIVELKEATEEIPLAIKESFGPNVYCAVTVIRPVEFEDEWSSHRAYGIIPIMLDDSTHKLKVGVSTLEKVSPGDTARVSVDIKGESGNIGEVELSIALIDEGVLRLTGFKTPDPYDFFYGRRGNKIETSDIYSLLMPEVGEKKVGADSAPSGDRAADYDPKSHLNPIKAKRVKPVALWKTGIVTDAQGRATAEFKIPQFVGNLKVMVVAAGGKDFGNGDSDIKVVEPLMIEPTLPRFLSVGDIFIVPVSLLNSTGKGGKAKVSIEASQGFKISGKESFDIRLNDNEERTVSFKLTAPLEPGKGDVTISASMDEYSASRRIELPVRPPAPLTTISGSGKIEAPGDKNIDIPGGWLKGTGKSSLSIMSLPGLQFAGGLKFLAQYPYGCIEQTTSCVFPLLYLKDVAGSIDSNKFSPAMIDSYVDAGIQRVLSMQTYSGGFSYWPGYQNEYSWGSIYATDFLVEADKAGYNVPKFEKDIALDYLEKLLPGKNEEDALELKSYSLFVLSKAGRMKSSWIRRLQEVKDKMPGYSRFHLASSLALLGDKDAVSDILGQGIPDTAVERERGDSLNSYVRQNAVALSIYMDIEPENEMVPVLVKRLEGSMKDGNWGTTQDNAAALLALGKYARFVEGQSADYSGTVKIGRELVSEFDDEEPIHIKNVALWDKKINVSVQGEGTAYYYWSAEGVPSSGKVEEKDKGIKVRRSLFTREGQPLDIDKIKQGDIVIVDISIETAVAYKNVVVEDLLPGCFEIENPRIATRESVGWLKKDAFEPDHIDIRDDRFLMFTDLPKVGLLRYRYVVRAVTKGDFTLPPISASCMYDPSILSVNGAGKIRVGKNLGE